MVFVQTPVRVAVVCAASSFGFGSWWATSPSSQGLPAADIVPHPQVQSLIVEESISLAASDDVDKHVDVASGSDVADDSTAFDLMSSWYTLIDLNIVRQKAEHHFNLDRPASFWMMLASLPLDCLLMLIFWGWCPTCSKRHQSQLPDAHMASIADGEKDEADKVSRDLFAAKTSEKTLDCFYQVSHSVEADVPVETEVACGRSKSHRSEDEIKAWMKKQREQCSVVENVQALVETDAKASRQAQEGELIALPVEAEKSSSDLSKRQRTEDEVKALMRKKREQCEVVESTQAHIETDAKAHSSSRIVNPPARNEEHGAAEGADVSRSQRTRRRDAGDLKALMEKLNEGCHILEGTQEHISTDAKATEGCSQRDNKAPSSSGRRCGTSKEEMQAWMSGLRDQCTISEGTQEFIQTDAKCEAASNERSLMKENVAWSGDQWPGCDSKKLQSRPVTVAPDRILTHSLRS